MRCLMTWVVALACCLPIACSSSDGGDASNNGSGGTAGTNQGGSGGSGGTSGSNSGGTAGTGGSGVINPEGGLSDAADDGCAKVDFLFVVDNSVSMKDQQAALIASFPGFMASIKTTLSKVNDYHIMVVDTDETTRCTPENCQTGEMSADTLCIAAANGYACNTTFEPCDNTLGAGVVHPAGDGASNKLCEITGGNRYITQEEQDLDGTFACVAQVGLAGHPSERPMDAMVAALADGINGPGGCNEGFLRDDAILVVTFISDDPNYEDAGGPQDWYDAVVAAKNGDPASVVVLGLTPAWDGCGPDDKPDKGAHWAEFLTMWGDHALHASVCNLDYAPFFDEAVSIIDTACNEFEPPK